MKKIIFVIIFLSLINFSFAEEVKEEKKPNSKIGIMIGGQWWKYATPKDSYDYAVGPVERYLVWETSKRMETTIFYNYVYDSNLFFSFNLGYNTYKKQTQKYLKLDIETGDWKPAVAEMKEPDNIFLAIGANWWCYSDKIYIGLSTGLLSQIKYNETDPIVNLIVGGAFPIPKYHISIEANMRIGSVTGINLGIAYLIP